MGASQSKGERLYQAAANSNHQVVKTLRRDGASLEWVDKEGRTPLILACTRGDLFDVVLTLINEGANLKAYKPGPHGGHPLHHAAERGLDKTVFLLLSRGADPLAFNDDHLTPLDMARSRSHISVVRMIEAHICLFSGVVRELSGLGFLDVIAAVIAPQWVIKKSWVVVLPAPREPGKPTRNELVIYANSKACMPRLVISLARAEVEEPKFNQYDPVLVIGTTEKDAKTKFLFLSENEGDKAQLGRFYKACCIPIHHPTCGDLVDVVLTLINQGANLNAYKPGPHGGHPLHHAVERGLEKTVFLLLSRGADPLAFNDDHLTPLDMARSRSHTSVVRMIEDHICLFSGVVRELSGLGVIAPRWLIKKSWVVVLPEPREHGKPTRNELVIYSNSKASTPRIVISLARSEVEEPKFNRHDPELVITTAEKNPKAKFKFLSDKEGDKAQLGRFYKACAQGIRQTESPISGVLLSSSQCLSVTASPPTLGDPSAPPLPVDGPIHYPSIDTSQVKVNHTPALENVPVGANTSGDKQADEKTSSRQCVVCWDSPAEAVCIPCGHLAGCMGCLREIKTKNRGCPVCRATIKQVVKVYIV